MRRMKRPEGIFAVFALAVLPAAAQTNEAAPEAAAAPPAPAEVAEVW